MTTSTSLITLAAWSRSVGITRQAGWDLARRGKLTLINGRVHPDIAAAEYAKVRSQTRIDAAPAQAAPAPAAVDDGPSYARFRAEREGYAAQRERMALQREARELLPAAEVHDAIDDAAALCRTALEQLPDRLAPRLAAIGADEGAAHALLAVAVNDALRALADRLAGLDGEVPAP